MDSHINETPKGVTVSVAVFSLVGPALGMILLLPTCKCDMFEQINLI